MKILKIEIVVANENRANALIDQITALIGPYEENGEYMSSQIEEKMI